MHSPAGSQRSQLYWLPPSRCKSKVAKRFGEKFKVQPSEACTARPAISLKHRKDLKNPGSYAGSRYSGRREQLCLSGVPRSLAEAHGNKPPEKACNAGGWDQSSKHANLRASDKNIVSLDGLMYTSRYCCRVA